MLDHVVWIGGGTGAGKTTVARLLAARYGLRAFHVDSFWYAHDERLREPRPAPEEQWLAPPEEQAAAFLATSRRRLGLVLDDLDRLPREPAIAVEGPQVLPELLPAGARAVFLAATPAFRRAILEARPLPPTSDPERALRNRIEKDQLVGEHVAAAARRRGFAVVEVDGSRPPADVAAEVGRALEPLPGYDGDLGPVRRWENEAFAANVRGWLASSDAPARPPGPFPFACECGRRGCAERVELTVDAFAASPRVLAPAH